MNCLLDTHAFVWWLLDDPRLSNRARELIAGQGNPCFVSAVTAFEISNKVRIGKIAAAEEIDKRFENLMDSNSFERLPITVAHSLNAGRLDGPHRDPFDRLLAAQSLVEGLPLVTGDAAFRAFGVECVW